MFLYLASTAARIRKHKVRTRPGKNNKHKRFFQKNKKQKKQEIPRKPEKPGKTKEIQGNQINQKIP